MFLDLEVLSKAPLRMIRAGLGDSVCRPTAQADGQHEQRGQNQRELGAEGSVRARHHEIHTVAPICEGPSEGHHTALRSAAAEAGQEEREVSGVGSHSAPFESEAIVVTFRSARAMD